MSDVELSARAKAGRLNAMARRHNSRFYISFSLRNGYNPQTGKWDKAVWPILFHTREDAEMACRCLPIFKNAELAGIKSASVERVELKPRWKKVAR